MPGKDMKSMATMLGGISNNTLNPYYRSGALASYELNVLEKTGQSVRYKVIAMTKCGVAHEDFIDLTYEEEKLKISRC